MLIMRRDARYRNDSRISAVMDFVKSRIALPRRNEESGIALVTVVVFMILGGLTTAVLLSVALANTANTAGQRLGVEAQAASDAGIERVVAWLDGRSVLEPATGVRTKRTYADIISGMLPPYSTFQIGSFDVEMEYTYRVLDNFRLVSKDTLGPSDNPVALIVKSTATPIEGRFAETRIASRVTVAEIALERDPVGFDKAIFNGGSSTFLITNDMQIIASEDSTTPDGHVYSNGSIDCRTQIGIEGTLHAQGGIILQNNCKVLSTVWANGNVSLQDGVTITADVYATGNVDFVNNEPAVNGHVIANGNVNIGMLNGNGQNRHKCDASGTIAASVCGSVLSYNGTISGRQGGRIQGHAVARGGINFQSPYNGITAVAGYAYSIDGDVTLADGKVGGDIRAGGITDMSTNGNHFSSKNSTGTSCQNGAQMFSTNCASANLNRRYPELAAAGDGADFPDGLFRLKADGSIDWQNPAGVYGPPTDADWGTNGMPRINAPQAVTQDPSAPPATEQTFDPWSTWTVIRPATCDEAKTILKNGSFVNETILWIDDCVLDFNNGDVITLVGDLAIMSPRGFNMQNGNGVQINAAVSDPNMFWIVPADTTLNGNAVWPEGTLPPGTGGSCSSGNITLDNPKVGNPSSFRWMLYTPCKVEVRNQINGVWRGQLYGGSVSVPNNSKFQMDMVPVPSEPRVPEPSDPINAKITGRYNLVYGL